MTLDVKKSFTILVAATLFASCSPSEFVKSEQMPDIFQSGCHLPHGTSFMVIRQAIRYCRGMEDYELARKYCKLLETSPANRGMARRALKEMEGRFNTFMAVTDPTMQKKSE